MLVLRSGLEGLSLLAGRYPESILYKYIAGRYRPVRVAGQDAARAVCGELLTQLWLVTLLSSLTAGR